MAALFFDDFNGPAGNLVGRVVGSAVWQSNSNSPLLDGNGNVLFPEGAPMGYIDVTVDAPVYDVTMVYSSTLAPFQNMYFGIGNSPMVGQSYSGAQINIDTAAGSAAILGTYGSQSFPFTPAPSMKFTMRLTTGSTLVELFYQDGLIGSYNIESPVNLSTPKLFVNGSTADFLASIGVFTPEQPEVSAFWTNFVNTFEVL